VIAEVTGETPATKEDLTKVIEEQVEMTPEVREKMKPGIDNIWATVELTGEKAKEITDEAAAADEAALEASINETI